MSTLRISASSYSNTAPLVWSFLYGQNHGRVEMLLDTAPARSAALLAQNRVDAALVPVIAFQTIENARLVPDVCVGAREKVRSVALVTKGEDLADIKKVALDISSKTSVVLTKLIFREFLGSEPAWEDVAPDLDEMLKTADCALLIGDPALTIDESRYRKFDLAEVWREFTGYGFVFAMWMTQNKTLEIDFSAARDEGLAHIEEIISNYENEIPLSRAEFRKYLTENISYRVDDSMQKGLELYFKLAGKNGLIQQNKPLEFTALR
jgi:chorismate dehydratase